MEVVGEFLGYDCEKATWEYFGTHHRSMFPRLGSRSSFVRQAANLWAYKRALQQELVHELGADSDPVHLVDGLPLTVAGFTHAKGCHVFRGEAAYGKTHGQTFYGFRGFLLVKLQGIVSGFTLGPANTDERAAMWDVVDNVQGLTIADSGLAGQFHREEMARVGVELWTLDSGLLLPHREMPPILLQVAGEKNSRRCVAASRPRSGNSPSGCTSSESEPATAGISPAESGESSSLIRSPPI